MGDSLTIESAIKHAEEVAEENERKCNDGQLWDVNEKRRKYAAEHRQLAEWLKDYKRLLEREPCEDAISREDALMALTGEWTESRDEILSKAIRRIKALPSVNPLCPECGAKMVKTQGSEE